MARSWYDRMIRRTENKHIIAQENKKRRERDAQICKNRAMGIEEDIELDQLPQSGLDKMPENTDE